ncbi:MAG: ABC transporter permease [Chitinophagaceae bacterium]
MIIDFVHSFQSEWLKKKKSAASWLTVIGGFFIPAIMLIARFTDITKTVAENSSASLWETLYNRCWQFMGLFLLPMGVILATSLITQLEFRNNTWKQIHATPQTFTTLFFAKLSVIVVMMVQFFLLFNLGILVIGMLPALIIKRIPFPVQSIPLLLFLKGNLKFFIDCLPIIALQYLISLQFKNFMVPIGVGLSLLVASMIGISWKYGYLIPYSYCTYNFLGKKIFANQSINIHFWAIGYFLLFSVASYFLYINRREKG